MKPISTEESYIRDLQTIKETIKENRYKALVVVNSVIITTYHRIGTIINERKEWGNKYIQRLAEDLKGYGRGYSYDQLKRMARFASIFSEDEIRARAVPQIPWRSIIEIMNKASSKEEALWYMNQTYRNKWSKEKITEQFKIKAYERKLIEPQVTEVVKKNEQLKDIFKDTLLFDFLGNIRIKDEKDLKDRLLDNTVSFLQELGSGFALVDREYKLVTPTGKNYYIDLLMYHTKVHAYVVIEVKIGDFQPCDIGQLQFYINAIDDLEKSEEDNPTVGLLLCKTADSYVVKTTLKTSNVPIGVSKYKLFDDLPNYLLERMKEIK